MYYLIDSIKSKHFLLPIFILLTILNCWSVYASSLGAGMFNALWQLILFLMFVKSLSRISSNQIRIYFIFIIMLVSYTSLFFMLNYLRSGFNIGHFLILLLIDPIMLVTYFFAHINNRGVIVNNLLFLFNDIVIILAVISLIFWIISFLGIKTNIMLTVNGGKDVIPGYFGVDFFSQSKIGFLSFSIPRNTGIFMEAPFYSYVLCISLIIELFIKKQHSIFNKRVILLFITILSTTSITGILISIISLVIAEFIFTRNNLLSLVLLALIPFIVMLLRILFDSKANGVSSDNQEFINSSYGARRYDFITCFKAWSHHLIIGNGLNNDDGIASYGSGLIANGQYIKATGGTTGLMSVLAHGGIMYLLFYLIPTLLYSFKSFRAFMFSIITFILFIMTAINNSYIYIIILSYFWAESLVNR